MNNPEPPLVRAAGRHRRGGVRELLVDQSAGFAGNPLFHVARILFVSRGNGRAALLIRLIQVCRRRGWRLPARVAAAALRRDFGSFVQGGARIGPGLRLPHPNGIVIGSGVRIGARCTIYHQVTFGAARLGEGFTEAYPQVGDDVTIFAGAKLIGAIRIGDGAVIGANAVVLRDVPAHHRAVGIPAVCVPLRGR